MVVNLVSDRNFGCSSHPLVRNISECVQHLIQKLDAGVHQNERISFFLRILAILNAGNVVDNKHEQQWIQDLANIDDENHRNVEEEKSAATASYTPESHERELDGVPDAELLFVRFVVPGLLTLLLGSSNCLLLCRDLLLHGHGLVVVVLFLS